MDRERRTCVYERVPGLRLGPRCREKLFHVYKVDLALQGCNTGVLVVYERCSRGVSRICYGCNRGVIRVN